MQIEIALAWCRSPNGREWTAGKLYLKGAAPSAEEAYNILAQERRLSASSQATDDEGGEAVVRPTSNRQRRRSTVQIIVGRISRSFSASIENNASSCILNGFALEWSFDTVDSTRARWTLCTQSDHHKKLAEKAEELDSSATLGATTVLEKITQVQFFHPLFRKYSGARESPHTMTRRRLLPTSDSTRSSDNDHSCMMTTNFRLANGTKSACTTFAGTSLVGLKRSNAGPLEIAC